MSYFENMEIDFLWASSRNVLEKKLLTHENAWFPDFLISYHEGISLCAGQFLPWIMFSSNKAKGSSTRIPLNKLFR